MNGLVSAMRAVLLAALTAPAVRAGVLAPTPTATICAQQSSTAAPGPGAALQDPAQGQTEASAPPQAAPGDQRAGAHLESLEEAQPFDWSRDSILGVLTGRDAFTAADGALSFRLGVAVQVDGTTATESGQIENAFGPADSSVDLRRLRLSSHGRLRDLDFMVSYDLGADYGLKDLWFEGRTGGLSLYDHMLGRFRFGHMKEPFGFEAQSSFSFFGLMERSLPAQTFGLGRNLGAMVHDVSESGRVSWAAGIFSLGSTNQDSESSSLFSITGRVTGLPICAADGSRLLHVGASFSNRSPSGDTRYFARPEARAVDPYADTGDIDASNINLFGLEIAGVHDSWWTQAEWIHSSLTAPDSDDPAFDGGYLQLGWFLTGERRPYRKNGATFDRFSPEIPNEDWKLGSRIRGGAWELVGRASRVDLDDGLVTGGVLTDYSLGLNWYVSHATRVQLNYVYSMPKDLGHADILMLRLQFQPW